MCNSCMFCQVRSFFCCMSLRTGCIASGLYALIAGILYSIVAVKGAVEYEKRHKGEAVTFDEIMRYLSIIFYVFWAISGMLLLCVVCRTMLRSRLMPFMVLTCIVIIINILSIINAIVDMANGKSMNGEDWTSFILDITYTGLQIYAVMVVASYYRNNMTESDAGCC